MYRSLFDGQVDTGGEGIIYNESSWYRLFEKVDGSQVRHYGLEPQMFEHF